MTDRHIDIDHDPDALRQAMIAHFARRGMGWALCAQLCTALERMPVEDASVIWPENESPYRPVARLRFPAQEAWSPTRSREIDDAMAFSPWNGLAAHQPLGQIMRLRRSVYAHSAAFRGVASAMPQGWPEPPDDP